MINKKVLFILTALLALSMTMISCGINPGAVDTIASAKMKDTEEVTVSSEQEIEQETETDTETDSEQMDQNEENAKSETQEADVSEDSTENETESEKPEAATVSADFATEEISNESSDWGLSFGSEGEIPVGNASAEDLRKYNAYYTGDTSEKVIYITFDTGYENGNTGKILDALKKHNAEAAFFVVGNFLETNPDLVKRMQEEGHIVANHMYDHPDMEEINDIASFQKEVDQVANLYKEITGEEMLLYYRPPSGQYNAWNLNLAKQLGYKTFFWSLAYVDWLDDNQPTHEEAYDKLLTRVHPGAIVLLHSTSKTNAEIMDDLLTKWEEMGYTFGSISYIE